ncbi:BTAD domain-containing putative transcriptional regulator [Micromonosporaceae bacterium Da 78-11]
MYKEEAARAAAWTVWLLITLALAAVLADHTRTARWSRFIGYLPRPVQSLTAAILGTAVVTTAVNGAPTPAAASSTAAGTADHVQAHPSTTPSEAPITNTNLDLVRARHTVTAAPVAGFAHHRDSPTSTNEARGAGYRVKPRDNLWDLAHDKLGNPQRWREIYTLNRGHKQADGHALTHPDDIRIGWHLDMPARHTTSAQTHANTPTPPGATALAHNGGSKPGSGDHATASSPSSAAPIPATPAPTTSTPPAPAGPSAPVAPSVDAVASPTAPAPAEQNPPATTTPAPEADGRTAAYNEAGISLPSRSWISLGLASLIAAVASILRLQRRRRAHLTFPIPARLTAQPTPIPAPLTAVGAVGGRHLSTSGLPHGPAAPAASAPIGIDTAGHEVSLFDLPGPGLALAGEGAELTARAILAAALTTGVTTTAEARPVVVTTAEILARLLPAGAPLVGLDPNATSYDGERLIVLDEVAAAVTHAEEEMIMRRRLLDTFDLDSITALNERTDHAEAQPPYVLLIEAAPRHAARLRAVAAHQAALRLHPVIVGPLHGIPTADIAADGIVAGNEVAGLARLSILAADDLAAVLAMLSDVAPRPEPGYDIDLDPALSDLATSSRGANDPAAALDTAPDEAAEDAPAQVGGTAAPVRLRVLGPPLVETQAGPVATGMRSGSYTVLASLAVHPGGRTLDQLAADLHPDTEPSTAGKRIRTDISTTRRVLRTATGTKEPMFVNYDPATGRYRLDPDLITVDLWQMLTAIKTANTADDTTALAALREAAELYGGDFADGGDQTWMTEHATSYRHQILAVYARIAEIIEADHPDQAAAALEHALEFDPVNEELYQRIMRIHGRAGRPDAVRRILRRLEERLADLGDAEPSEATRRVAERQLRPATTSGARS